MTAPLTPNVPYTHTNEQEHRRMLAFGVERLLDGKIRSFGEITLDANQSSTTLSDRRIGPKSAIMFFPLTENAAGNFGGGGMYVSARTNEQATINHTNDTFADKTFMYVVLGQQ